MTTTDEKDERPSTKKAQPERLTVTLSPPSALVRERDALLRGRPSGVAIAEEGRPPAVSVTSAEEYVAVVEDVQRLKAAEKRFAEAFLESRRPLRQAAERNIELERLFLQPLRDRIAAEDRAVAEWRAAQREREEALKKAAREEAERKAREERQQMLDALEAARRATPSRVEKKALADQKAQLAAAPVAAPSAVVPSTVPKLSGVYDVETWSAEVVDLEALVLAVAVPLLLKRLAVTLEAIGVDEKNSVIKDWLAAQTPAVAKLEMLLPNMEALDAVAVRCRDDVPIPGVVGRRKVTTVTRAAKAAFDDEEMV